MGESIGKPEETTTKLKPSVDVLNQGKLQKSTVIILAQIRSKPVKQDAKDKKAKVLKTELQEIRKLGFKEDQVLPKTIHDTAIKAVATGGAM